MSRPQHSPRLPSSGAIWALLLTVVLAQSSVHAAAAPAAAPDNSNSSSSSSDSEYSCHSLSQCYVVRLGPPNTPGEWLAAYVAAAHEHCRDLMLQGGAARCRSSIRCVYAAPAGSSKPGDAVRLMGSSSGHQLVLDTNTTITSSSSSNATSADFLQHAAAALGLRQPACLPNIFALPELRARACRHRTQALHAAGAVHSDPATDALLRTCMASPGACFVANASDAAKVAAWWTGPVPAAVLDPPSSSSGGGGGGSSAWLRGSSLHDAAAACSDAWASGGPLTRAMCATRGTGPASSASSLSLSRLVVAIMDAYEASTCNNTVTAAEALAVQRISQDIACRSGACRAASGAQGAAMAAGLRGAWPALLAAAGAALALALGGT